MNNMLTLYMLILILIFNVLLQTFHFTEQRELRFESWFSLSLQVQHINLLPLLTVLRSCTSLLPVVLHPTPSARLVLCTHSVRGDVFGDFPRHSPRHCQFGVAPSGPFARLSRTSSTALPKQTLTLHGIGTDADQFLVAVFENWTYSSFPQTPFNTFDWFTSSPPSPSQFLVHQLFEVSFKSPRQVQPASFLIGFL